MKRVHHDLPIGYGSSDKVTGKPVPDCKLLKYAAIWVCFLVAGCETEHFSNPAAMMLDREAHTQARLAAERQLWQELSASGDANGFDAYLAALAELAWSDRHPVQLRILAVDRLIELDAKQFKHQADRRIRHVNEWLVLEHIYRRAAQEQWLDFTLIAVRRWAKPSQVYRDEDRPERRLLEKLNPGKAVDRILLDVLGDQYEASQLTHHVSAWTVLNRIMDTESLRHELMKLKGQTMLIDNLHAAVAVLDVLPPDREGVLRLISLRCEQGGRYWQSAGEVSQRLSPGQKRGLALRHLPLLVNISEQQLQLSRDELAGEIRQRLGRVRHYQRQVVGMDGYGYEAVNETIEEHLPTLTWADLIAISKILDAMTDGRLISEVFEQVDADFADQSTERGGVLIWADERIVAKQFKPMAMDHDRVFYATPLLIEQMYTGLAHYHFHVQEYDNELHAGPGGGDLMFADNLHASAVVFTFIDRNTLNIDYYQPGRVVVDLGVIKR